MSNKEKLLNFAENLGLGVADTTNEGITAYIDFELLNDLRNRMINQLQPKKISKKRRNKSKK
jgi:hypothetical protein